MRVALIRRILLAVALMAITPWCALTSNTGIMIAWNVFVFYLDHLTWRAESEAYLISHQAMIVTLTAFRAFIFGYYGLTHAAGILGCSTIFQHQFGNVIFALVDAVLVARPEQQLLADERPHSRRRIR